MPALTVNTRATNGGDAHELDLGRINIMILQNISTGGEVVYFSRRAAVTATGSTRGARLKQDEYYESAPLAYSGIIYVTSDTDGAEILYETL